MVIRYLFVARKSSNARYRRASILHIGQLETRPCGAVQRATAFFPRSYRSSPATAF